MSKAVQLSFADTFKIVAVSFFYSNNPRFFVERSVLTIHCKSCNLDEALAEHNVCEYYIDDCSSKNQVDGVLHRVPIHYFVG